MKIISEDRNIQKLFESGFYKIPRFQRPYSWDKDNLEEFWYDVTSSDNGDYFLGSMVVYKNDIAFNIVDGQQRLTTITILLCTIRNYFKEYKYENLARGIHNVIERPDISYKLQYVIQPETSYPYFQEIIQKYDAPDSSYKILNEEKRLKEAYEFFFERVGSLISSKSSSPDKILISLREKLLGLSFVYIQLENEEDAYIIFETLNTRGKDLSVSDLLKNYFTKLIKNDNKNVDIVKDKWNELNKTIQSISNNASIDQFILHYWLSKYKYSNLKKIYKGFKKIVVKNNAKKQLDDIVKNSLLYKQVLSPAQVDYSKQEMPIFESIKAINTFGLLQTAPLALSILRHYRDKNMSMKMTKEWFSVLEKFHFIFTAITSTRASGGLGSMYANAARILSEEYNKDKISKHFKEFRQKLKDRIPDKEIFKINLSMIDYTSRNTKDKRLIQYILKKLSEHFSSNIGVSIDYESLTIEHISPENPPSKKVPPYNVGSIGNLLFINNKLQDKLKNKPFEEKISIIKNSGVPIDSFLLNLKSMKDKDIEKRTDHLGDILYDEIFHF